MVVFPLLYPEVFEKFGISPPRGVLFYGPPGMTSIFDISILSTKALYSLFGFFSGKKRMTLALTL